MKTTFTPQEQKDWSMAVQLGTENDPNSLQRSWLEENKRSLAGLVYRKIDHDDLEEVETVVEALMEVDHNYDKLLRAYVEALDSPSVELLEAEGVVDIEERTHAAEFVDCPMCGKNRSASETDEFLSLCAGCEANFLDGVGTTMEYEESCKNKWKDLESWSGFEGR